MDKYLVDVPVKITIWIRPELQKRQFDVVRKAKPSTLFIVSDGGRNDKEWELILKNRELYDKLVDWDCKIYKLYLEKNYGMYSIGQKIHKFIWEHTDRCIMLEDDHIPSVSYFRFCAELLEKYKDDLRISFINGVNYQVVTEDCPFDYFFSRNLTISGYATWKRTYEDFYDLSYKEYPYIVSLLKKLTLDNPYTKNTSHWMQIHKLIDNDYYNGHVPLDEFYLTHSFYRRHQMAIVPKYNLISNVGVGGDTEHSDSLKNLPKGIAKVFNQKTYELNFPLKHNDFILPNLNYEKYRMNFFAFDNPIVYYYRRFVRAFLILKNCGFRKFYEKFTKHYKIANTKSLIEN